MTKKRIRKTIFLRVIFGLSLIAAAFSASGLHAEEEAKKTSQTYSSSRASGGMTYSPTQGWVKTSDQMKVGTDSLTYENQKKAIADAVKQNREKIAKEKAEAAAKEKLWQEAQKAEAEKLAAEKIAAEKAKEVPGKKNKTARAPQPKDKNKSASGRSRVFVS